MGFQISRWLHCVSSYFCRSIVLVCEHWERTAASKACGVSTGWSCTPTSSLMSTKRRLENLVTKYLAHPLQANLQSPNQDFPNQRHLFSIEKEMDANFPVLYHKYKNCIINKTLLDFLKVL